MTPCGGWWPPLSAALCEGAEPAWPQTGARGRARRTGTAGRCRPAANDHIANPRDDLTSYLVNAELGGRKLDPAHIVGTMALLLIAGIDTTASAIGAALWHLAKTSGDRKRLAAEPGLLPVAMEELLRAYAPVTMARLVTADTCWRGAGMKADDWVLLSYPAANRDPAQFERPDEVVRIAGG